MPHFHAHLSANRTPLLPLRRQLHSSTLSSAFVSGAAGKRRKKLFRCRHCCTCLCLTCNPVRGNKERGERKHGSGKSGRRTRLDRRVGSGSMWNAGAISHVNTGRESLLTKYAVAGARTAARTRERGKARQRVATARVASPATHPYGEKRRKGEEDCVVSLREGFELQPHPDPWLQTRGRGSLSRLSLFSDASLFLSLFSSPPNFPEQPFVLQHKSRHKSALRLNPLLILDP